MASSIPVDQRSGCSVDSHSGFDLRGEKVLVAAEGIFYTQGEFAGKIA